MYANSPSGAPPNFETEAAPTGLAVAVGEEVEVIRPLAVLDDNLTGHRRLRMDKRANVDVRIDVGLGLDRANLDHGSGPCIVSTRERFS